jgi:hypothetical protein
MAKKIRNLEDHFNIDGRVHVAQVCSPDSQIASRTNSSMLKLLETMLFSRRIQTKSG